MSKQRKRSARQPESNDSAQSDEGWLDSARSVVGDAVDYGNAAVAQMVDDGSQASGSILDSVQQWWSGEEEEEEQEQAPEPQQPQTKWHHAKAAMESGDTKGALDIFLAMNPSNQAKWAKTHKDYAAAFQATGDPRFLQAKLDYFPPKKAFARYRLHILAGMPDPARALAVFKEMPPGDQTRVMNNPKLIEPLDEHFTGDPDYDAYMREVWERGVDRWMGSKIGDGMGAWQQVLDERVRELESLGADWFRSLEQGQEIPLADSQFQQDFGDGITLIGSSSGTATVESTNEHRGSMAEGQKVVGHSMTLQFDLDGSVTHRFNGHDRYEAYRVTSSALYNVDETGLFVARIDPVRLG